MPTGIDLTGGLVGGVLDLIKGWQQSEAQSRANEDNINFAKQQWASQIALDQIARGLPYQYDQNWINGGAQFPTGTPVHMPYYAKTGNDSDEILAYRRANDIFNSTANAWGSPSQQISNYTNIANQSKPAITNATKAINDLFSGARTQQRLSEQAPVNQARINTAQGQRSAVYQNLQNRLNELKARQGFIGSSTFDRAAQFREAMPFYQEAANVMSAARLQNALDEQAIRNQDWQTAFANVNVPYDLAVKNVAFEQMPALQAVNAFNQAYGVYSPFLLEQWQSPTAPAMPQVQPVMSFLGNAASAGGDFLQGYLQNLAQERAAEQYRADQKDLLNTLISANKPSGYSPANYTYYDVNPYGN